MIDLSKYRAEGDYPEVDEAFEPLEAKKLQNVYSGRESELTAILQYAFQSYISDDEEAKALFEGIGITEMTHHEMLGTAIHNLGGYPVMGGRNYPWNGSFVNYANDLKRMVEIDIKGEEQAIIDYEKTILVLKNEQAKALVARIIEDEELHVKLLTEFLERLTAKG